MDELDTVVHDTISEVNVNQWDNLVAQSDQGGVFHRSGWLKAVEAGLDVGLAHVGVYDDGNPIAVFPNVVTDVEFPDWWSLVEDAVEIDGVTLPARLREAARSAGKLSASRLPIKQVHSTSPGYGGPVIASHEAEVLDRMFEALSNRFRSTSTVLSHIVEAKEPSYLRYGKYLRSKGYESTRLTCRFEVGLDSSWDAITADMHKSRRKAIRKARSRDHRIYERDLDDDLATTYDMYTTDLERVDGRTLPKSFFQALAHHFGDRTVVFVAEVEGQEVGRYVYLLDDGQSTLHHFFSAVGDESNFEDNPTELLHAHAMEWGMEHGYEQYDLGATGADFRDGRYKYKERYGGSAVPTFRWERGYDRPLWPLYRSARNLYWRITQ